MKSYVIGYAMSPTGQYDKKYYFENTADNIARFVMQNQTKDCVVTDEVDNLVCSTLMGFIDRCPDQKYLGNELLPAITKYQLDGKELIPIEFVDGEYGDMVQKGLCLN